MCVGVGVGGEVVVDPFLTCFCLSNVVLFACLLKHTDICNLWTILDVATIALTFTAVLLWDRPELFRVGLYTFVVGLLWARVLSFLKVINR